MAQSGRVTGPSRFQHPPDQTHPHCRIPAVSKAGIRRAPAVSKPAAHVQAEPAPRRAAAAACGARAWLPGDGHCGNDRPAARSSDTPPRYQSGTNVRYYWAPHPLPEPTHHQAPPGQRSDEIRVRNGTELERQRSIAEERIDGATADHEVIHPSTPRAPRHQVLNARHILGDRLPAVKTPSPLHPQQMPDAVQPPL